MCAKFWKRIDSVLLGSVLTLHQANKKVEAKIKECQVDQFKSDNRLKNSKADLNAMLAMSVQRLERIENKAMGTLLGVAVAIAVFAATSDLLGSRGMFAGHPLRIVAAALLLIAMVYLFGSEFLALQAYKIGDVYHPTLSDRAPVADDTEEAKVLIYSIEQNQRAATLRGNRLFASFACLRNGLVAVLVLGALVIFVAVLRGAQCGANQPIETDASMLCSAPHAGAARGALGGTKENKDRTDEKHPRCRTTVHARLGMYSAKSSSS